MYPNEVGETAAGAEARAMASISGPLAGLTAQELADASAADIRKESNVRGKHFSSHGLTANAQKIENDTNFQISSKGSLGYLVDQAAANKLGVTLAELQAAAQELVARNKAVNTVANYIRKV